MQFDFFPVPLDKVGAKLTFWQPEVTEFVHPMGIAIRASRHNHPGGAYGYRITEGDKTLVYCTDVEHGDEIDKNVVALSRNADLLIHDAQYTPDELKERKGWGHSSWEQAAEVAERAAVKKLALFHHDPEHSDAFLAEVEVEVQKTFPMAFFAREGMEIEL
jgi:ribonuclease BN (tRNA processing enzyme)